MQYILSRVHTPQMHVKSVEVCTQVGIHVLFLDIKFNVMTVTA